MTALSFLKTLQKKKQILDFFSLLPDRLQWIDLDNYNNGIIAICQQTVSVSLSQNNQSKTDSFHTRA